MFLVIFGCSTLLNTKTNFSNVLFDRDSYFFYFLTFNFPKCLSLFHLKGLQYLKLK